MVCLAPLSERDLKLLFVEEGTGGSNFASIGPRPHRSDVVEGSAEAWSAAKRVPTEGERAGGFFDYADIEASSAEKRVPAEGERAEDFLDNDLIEASSAEKWSNTVLGVSMAWLSTENRSERGSSGNTIYGKISY